MSARVARTWPAYCARETWQGAGSCWWSRWSLSSCGWHGIANVPIPGGPGAGSGSYTVYVQMPDTLAINGNSKVMVADVFVGSIAPSS